MRLSSVRTLAEVLLRRESYRLEAFRTLLIDLYLLPIQRALFIHPTVFDLAIVGDRRIYTLVVMLYLDLINDYCDLTVSYLFVFGFAEILLTLLIIRCL